MTNHFDRPRGARGLLPLIIGALKVGGAIYGAVDANQQKQRTMGYLSEAYGSGVQRMNTRQNVVREDTAESLARRGLLNGGYSPIHRAMAGEIGTSGVQERVAIGKDQQPVTNDLAGATTLRNEREFDIERHDLDAAYTRDINENRANAINAQIGAIAKGVEGVASAYGTAQDMKAMDAMKASGNTGKSPIASALLSGSSYDGVHPVDPLNDPNSAWHMGTPGRTLNGAGLTNSDFNTSGVG